MDCIIQSLCSPLLKDCSRIELPRLSLDGNRFGCAEIHSIITTLFQTNFLILSQINSKKYQFHTFYALKLTNGNLHESYSVSLSGEKKKTMNSINFVFDLT